MTLEPSNIALLTLDMQNGIFALLPDTETIVPAASKAVTFARAQGIPVIHVGLGFNSGHPEIADGSPFAQVKQNNLYLRGTEATEFHSAIYAPGELVIYKQRISAFAHNELHTVLRSQGIGQLVLMGIATSGIVLSTVRQAFDLDYHCTVLADACADRDEEVHRVLMHKVFARQAKVLSVDAWIAGG